jgi:sugar phosphate isomerase/epimerase
VSALGIGTSTGSGTHDGSPPGDGSLPEGGPLSLSKRPDPRLSLNQATIKHADLATALRVTADAGIQAIGLWREPVNEVGLETAARMLADSGLRFSTHCRGGFFTLPAGPARDAALDDNRRAVEETAALAAAGADGSTAVLVLVAGGLPEGSRDLIGARERVRDALGALAPDARAAGVTLAIEPLHPMYAADRAVVSTLGQALDIAADFDADVAGVAVDTFHIWWDPQVLDQIARAGREGRIATYQVCDWKTPLAADVLLSRHYPGEGVIDFGSLTRAVVEAGYDRDIEVELFHSDIWADAPSNVARRTAESFGAAVSPHLPAAGR